MKKTVAISTIFSIFTIASPLHARNLFLNGIDISSAKHQLLENVTLRIDGNGNIYIEAPHYQVNEENNYIPLSSWKQGNGLPTHQPSGPLRQKEVDPRTQPSSQPVTVYPENPASRDTIDETNAKRRDGDNEAQLEDKGKEPREEPTLSRVSHPLIANESEKKE